MNHATSRAVKPAINDAMLTIIPVVKIKDPQNLREFPEKAITAKMQLKFVATVKTRVTK